MSAAESSTKSAAAFRTISEVSGDLNVPQHVLRFWETKFPQVKPLKRAGRRRYYRPEDLKILRQIRDLLYKDGYTIKGVQKLFKEGAFKAKNSLDTQKVSDQVTKPDADPLENMPKEALDQKEQKPLTEQFSGLTLDHQQEILNELKSIRSLLD
ncbi:transcriptional regulator [Kiloniella litopenaei]|uniref:Transcriptional regulator n=1 Tax=Kiloniella litopenaei TaxID=1549748 RepID=A0A0M2R1Y2_9PROT|nr:MerR family transcriptional regulator [Kiloniella litopenaei]KKJ75887.1 transcriptional regulator [Kiloniella litopenaei]